MAAKPRKKDGDDTSNSILNRLIEEQKEKNNEDLYNDVSVLFCGMKKAGKTSLIDRFINPQKDDKDIPKPTVALDYKFARYASETSTTKILAHLYDLGGDESFEEIVAIPVSSASIGNLVLAITLDLSEPQSVIPELENWLSRLGQQVNKSIEAMKKDSPTGAKQAEKLQQNARQPYDQHPDAAQVKPFPVPLVIFAAKCDSLMADVDPEKRKGLCKALRFFAHVNGASLVFTSLKEKGSMNAMRNLLRQLFFGVTAKGGVPEQLDPGKPICVLAGKDSLSSIGGQATPESWKQYCAQLFPLSRDGSKAAGSAEVSKLDSELLKYPESSVDGMVEQRTEELQQYRKQVERNQRLASEGVEGLKLGGFGQH